jgi:hypothetical protein
MLRFFARPVAGIGVVMLLVLLLGVANYGVLLHEQLVPPPIVNIALGPYDLRSWVDYDPPCGAHPYCQGARTKIFYVSLSIQNSRATDAPQMVQIVHLPLASP